MATITSKKSVDQKIEQKLPSKTKVPKSKPAAVEELPKAEVDTVTPSPPVVKKSRKSTTVSVPPVESKVETATALPETDVQNEEKQKRLFTVLRVYNQEGKEESITGGKFHSNTPAGAARKAANQACKQLYANQDDCSIDIYIKENVKSTKETGKEYGYHATRSLDNKEVPFKTNTEDKKSVSIPFKYKMILKSIKQEKKVVEEKENATVDVHPQV